MPITVPKMRRLYVPLRAPLMGLRYDAPSTMIETHESPDLREMRIDDGVMDKQPGTLAFAGTAGTPLHSSIMQLIELQSTLVCHTKTKQYTYNTGTSVFDVLTDAAGDHTGDEDDFFNGVWMNSLYIWTNGIDQPRKWSLSGAIGLLANHTNNRMKWLVYFGGRLCHYNTTESGTAFTKRVRWSVVDNPENITGAGSGALDLADSMRDSDSIVRAEALGNVIMIYGSDSIAMQEYRNVLTTPFHFTPVVPSVGLVAARALVSLEGKTHIFLGRDNIYAWTGVGKVEPIGNAISDELVARIDPTYANRSFAAYLAERGKIRFYIPTLGQTQSDVYFEYSLSDGSWVRGERDYNGYGRWRRNATPTWDSLTGSWDSQAWQWDSRSMIALGYVALYGDTSGIVHIDDESSTDLDGTAIDGWVDTRDFTIGDGYIRTATDWLELNFEAYGTTVDVSYSTDKGASYTLIVTKTLTANWAKYRVDLDVHSPQIRFRFRNNSTGAFALRWYEVGYVPASDR